MCYTHTLEMIRSSNSSDRRLAPDAGSNGADSEGPEGTTHPAAVRETTLENPISHSHKRAVRKQPSEVRGVAAGLLLAD